MLEFEVSPDAAALLTAGQVAAWRAGMAHYRAGALAVSRTLPPTLGLVSSELALWTPKMVGWPSSF